jgi:UDP-N-acetylglucosamine 2-epimerase (non-hydrolysing)
MKIAPIVRALAATDEVEQLLVHTGQHYDRSMSETFFEELELPHPDVHLGVGSGSHAKQTAGVMLAFEPVLEAFRPDWVIVVGDVNSTLACALTAAKVGIGVAHVEAGLRSFDRSMPEEVNRVLADHVADLLFTPSRDADANLRREGVPPQRIHFVGNVMIDTLVRTLPRTEWRAVLSRLGLASSPGPSPTSAGATSVRPYVLVTLHRPGNVDDPSVLREILAALDELGRELPIVFPVHPRTRRRLEAFALDASAEGAGIRVTEPLGYLDFLALERHAALVVTDSGGVQEETTYLGIPCLTIRPNTERPITITQGTNRLVRADRAVLAQAMRTALSAGEASTPAQPPPLWDGRAATRIVEIIRRTAPVMASPAALPLPTGP